jgi:hypothetical protein
MSTAEADDSGDGDDREVEGGVEGFPSDSERADVDDL